MSDSMSYRFDYLGREAHVYGLDVGRWFCTVDGSHILFGLNDEPRQWDQKRKAIRDAYAFILALSVDEGAA
jgi:hypothetical protein